MVARAPDGAVIEITASCNPTGTAVWKRGEGGLKSGVPPSFSVSSTKVEE